MIKYLFIFINSLSLFIYSLFSGDGGITVTNNIPKSILPGKEVPVEIKITKGSQGGFAKMQIELPTGLTIKEIDNKGANYSLVDGIAKWVWSSLPLESEIILKITLIADASGSGIKTITGKYSYVENNGKQVVEMTPADITIGTEDAVVNNNQAAGENPTNNSSPESNTPAPEKNETTVNTPTVETNQSTPPANSNSEPSVNITVQRTVANGIEGEYMINIKINKGSTKGFARYSDDIPDGMTAKAIKSEQASFSVSDGKIKFVWVSAPEKEEFSIAYLLTGVNKSINLNGEYSYLEQNQSKKYLLPVEAILIGNLPVETKPTESQKNETKPEPTTPVATNNDNNSNKNIEPLPVNTNTVAEVPKKTDEPTSEPLKNSKPQPEEVLTKNDVAPTFMVQIGAFTNSGVVASKLAGIFKISEKIKSEMQDGYTKFMVGNHAKYRSAREHGDKVRTNNNVNGAFVVAYNFGKRITVQEALMISNQKWFK